MASSEPQYFQQRIRLFQSRLSSDQAVIISSANDIKYFSNFEFLVPEEREAFFVVTKTSASLIISAFSPAPEFAKEIDLRILRNTHPAPFAEHVVGIVQEFGIKKVGFQDQSLFVNEFFALHKVIKDLLEPLPPRTVWESRMIKDELELKFLRKAGEIVAKAAKEIESEFKVGVSELELAEKLGEIFIKYGANGLGFPTIVAFGDHGTSPHYQPGETVLKDETAILIDCGAMVNGYRSDLTRTWWFGKKPAEEFTVIEGIVKAAYDLGVAEAKKHTESKKIDEVARKFITKEGYGPQFIHTTGHGVGLDIHEPPSLSWSDDTQVKAGMTITVEPGIYLEGKFGYRYENTLLITEAGAEILTQ